MTEKKEVMNRIKPIICQLGASVNSGLNAVLTPADCKTLLTYMSELSKRQKKGSRRAFDSIMEILVDEMDGFKEELLDQFRKG